jgi:RNA polymerase sigma-70 factor (ECF subfamily)
VDVAVLGAWEAAEVDAAQPADALFRLHYAPLAGWCRRMVGDEEVAHDIAAEAFVRLIGRWTSVTDPRAYLYTTALNLVRDRWRRSERERVAIRKTVMTMTTSAAPQGPELRMVVASLPKRLQQVVVLHYFADMSVEAVAHALGVAPGTVKRDLYDARAKLQVLLADSR